MEALPRPAPESDVRERLDELYERYHRQVFQAAHRVTGNPMDAEDALQTVFVRLLRRSRGPALSDDLGGYFHRAAVNAALDILRSRKAAATTTLDEAAARADQAAPDPERRVAGREIEQRIRIALTKLSPQSAEIFALRYFEGYGNHEIARMLDTSRSTVGVTLHRARHHVRNELRSAQEKHHDPE